MSWQTVHILLAAVAAAGACAGAVQRDEPRAAAPRDERGAPEGAALEGGAPAAGPERDAELEVSGLGAHLEADEIEAQVSRHGAALRRCFSAASATQPYLGGRVELSFAVAASGAVKHVQVTASDLGAWSVERCLVAVARHMTFPRPRGPGLAVFSLPLAFPAAQIATQWSSTRATAEVAGKLAELAACRRHGGRPRAIQVTLYVGTRGKVLSVGFASPSSPAEAAAQRQPIEEEWIRCAAAAALSWRLSDPRGRVAKAGFLYPVE